jgi:hypothetical protein
MILFEQAEGVLKEMQEGFKNQVDQEKSAFWKLLEAKSDKVQGSKVKFSAQVEEPQGVESRLDNTIPTATAGEYIEPEVSTTRIYGVLEFDSKMLKAAEGSKAGMKAYVNHVEQEMKGLKNTFLKSMARQAMGSKTGFMAACGTTAGSLTLQLATDAMMRHFSKNQHIDVVLAATGVAVANGTNRVIQSVDVANKRITLDAAGGVVTTDSTHRVTRYKSYNAEMTGLADIVSATSDIYGITTANYRRWKSYAHNEAAAMTIEKIAEIALASEIESGVFSDIIVSSPKKMQQVWKLLTGETTFDVATQKTGIEKLGFGYYKINVMIEGQLMEWISDVNCPEDRIYGLRKEDIGIQHLGPMSFMDVGGTILLPNIYGTGGTASYKAVMEYYPEIICMRRNSHWVWTGVLDAA